MTGYRYVSENDWLEIEKKKYLLPRPIQDWSVRQFFLEKKRFKGIWIWRHPLKGKAHVGAVIHQAIQKRSMKVYLLEVHYDEESLLKHGDYDNIVITHGGTLGKWKDWANGAQIAILIKPIRKDNIKLLHTYDLTKRLWQKNNKKKKN